MGSETTRWLLLLVAGLALLGLGIRKHDLLASSRAPGYGESLEEAVLVSGSEGSEIDLTPGRWYLTIVGVPSRDRELLKYLERLLHAPELKTHNLVVTAFLEGGAKEIAGVREQVEAFPVHDLHDFSSRDLRKLGIYEHEPAYLLVAPDLEIAFRSSYLQSRDLRLLLEKHFHTSIDHPSSAEALAMGSRFSPQDLVPVNQPLGGAEDAEDADLWVVFTPDCVSCAVQNRMEEVLAFEHELRRSGATERPVLLFSEAFDVSEVAEQLAYLGSALPAYVSPTPILGVEDPYLRRSLHGHEVVVVATDRLGAVEFVGSIAEYLRIRRSGKEAAT